MSSRKFSRTIGLLLISGLLVMTFAGCRGLFGRDSGPIDAFAFLPQQNPQLSEPVQGVINNRPDPKEIAVVVPPGTDMSRLVASVTLNTEGTITVISSGRRVPQNSLTPNNFTVPVTYAIELPGEDEPILYTVRVREASTNARLIELSIADSTYQTPTFGPMVQNYEAEVPFATTSIQVSARAEDPRASAISINGRQAGAGQATAPVDFSVGDSVDITVEVVAEDQETRQVYTITVFRGDPDTNSNLSALSVEGTSLDQVFLVDRSSYTATIPFSASEVTIVTRPESEFATTRTNGVPAGEDGAARVPLDNVQKQAVEIVVSAQDGSTSIYRLTLNRAAPDSNAELASLGTTAGLLSPVFSPTERTYSVSVPEDQNSVTLVAQAASDLTLVEATSSSPSVRPSREGSTAQAAVTLAEGEQAVIYFITRAENGESHEYRVAVRRDIGLESLVLSELSTDGVTLQPAFDPQVAEYSASVGADVEFVRLYATPADESVAVVVAGDTVPGRPAVVDVLLYEGVTSRQSIVLRAPNGLERKYTVSVSRPETQSQIGRRILQVTMNELRLSRMTAASLGSGAPNLSGEARIRVRYHGEDEIIFEGTAPVEFERTRQDVLVTMSYRSPYIDLDLGRYIDVEIAIPGRGSDYLTYNAVADANGSLDIRPEFLALMEQTRMDWPEPGTPRPVSARVLYQVSDQARRSVASLNDDFLVSDEGEFEVTLQVFDLASGNLLGTEILMAKPASMHGRGVPSVEGIELPEGAKVAFVMSAYTREGRLLRDHGAAEVRTMETFENGNWEYASLYFEGELELVERPGER